MRNLFLLAFVGFFSLSTSACGVVNQIAIDTCTQGNYNKFVCPGILEEALDETPVKTPKAAPIVTPNECKASGYMIRRGHLQQILTRSEGSCRNQRKLLEEHIRKVGPGIKCSWTKGQIKCAGIDSPYMLIALLLFAIGRRFPHMRGCIGVIGMLVGIAICTDANAKCVVLNDTLEKHKTGDAYARMRFQVRASTAMPLLKMMVNPDSSDTVKRFAIKVINDEVWCEIGKDANTIISQIKSAKDFLATQPPVPMEKRDAIFNVIWRGYVAKGGLKMGMSKEYIRKRWARAETAFWAVWADSPLWQAQVAAAICVKETNCGVTVKFSEWETHRFESTKNGNGTIDCGITQINSDYTDFSCDELQNLETAFQEQRRHIFMATDNKSEKAYWEKNIHRYNGAKAYEYGKTVWEWSGATFGWSVIWVFLCGLFRKKTAIYTNETQILKNRVVRINKKELAVDCVLIIKTYRDKSQIGHDGRHKIIGHHFTALNQDGAWERQGYHGDFTPCD